MFDRPAHLLRFFAAFLLAIPLAAQTVTIGPAVFTGAGLNDATSGGRFTSAAANIQYVVTISAMGTPDHFTWTKNGGSASSPVAITGSAQTLADGVTITFAATTGHTAADSWTINTTASGSIAGSTFVQRGAGAAISRNVQDKLRETVSVSDYGAVADGTGTGGTDQSAKIQAAINAVAADGGGTVYFPAAPNCYVVWAALIQPSNVVLEGAGVGSCLQKKFGAVPTCASGCTSVIEVGDGTYGPVNAWVRKLLIDGNRANVTGISGDGFNIGVYFRGATNSGIEDSVVENDYTGGVDVDCWGGGDTTAGNNVQIINTIITNSRRNNLEDLCGTNTIMRGGALLNANGGSLSLGADVEPFQAGQYVSGFQMDGVEVTGNSSGGISANPVYDANAIETFTNVNCHDNSGSQCLNAINYNVAQPGGAINGTLSIIGGVYSGGSISAVNASGWNYVLASGETITTSGGWGFLGGANNNVVELGPSTIGGATYDVSTSSGTTFQHGVKLVHGIVQSGSSNVKFPLYGDPSAWTQYGLAYWCGNSPRDGGMCNSAYTTVNDNGGTNPDILVSDGTIFVKMQLLTGSEGFWGTQSAHPACLGSNNTCRVTVDASGNVTISTGTTTINGGTQNFNGTLQSFQGKVEFNSSSIPTSCSGQVTGTMWNNAGALGLCP